MMDEQLNLEGGEDGGEGSTGDPKVDHALEVEALEQGWVPKEEWRGKPEEWTDAETFVRRGREINPILRKSLEREKRERQRLEKELADMKGTVRELAEHRAEVEKRIYDRAMKDLRTQRAEALTSGDAERLAEVEEAIDQMKEDPPKPATKPADPTPASEATMAYVADWEKANKAWYNVDEDMTDYANGVTGRLVAQAKKDGKAPDAEEILTTVSARVRARFPEKFKSSSAPAMFDSGGSGEGKGSTSGKGFSSLPPEAKAQFERFYKADYYPGMKKADAQAQYFADYQ